MQLKTIAVPGPGGSVGKAIITELLKDESRFTITAITRSRNTSPPNSSSMRQSLQASNSSLPMNSVGDITREQFRILPEAFIGAKCKIRAHLGELAREDKMAWTSLNGGPFFDMCFDILDRHARIYSTGKQPLRWTPLPSISLAAANMLRNPLSVLNRPMLICPFSASSTITQNTLLRTLEKLLDTTFTVSHVDVEMIYRNALVVLGEWTEGGEQEEGKARMGQAVKGLAVSNQNRYSISNTCIF